MVQCLSKHEMSVETYETVFTSDFSIQPQVTTVRVSKHLEYPWDQTKTTILIKLHTLYLIQTKAVAGSQHFIHLFQNLTLEHLPVTTFSLYESKLVCPVMRRVDVGRAYSFIAQNLNFGWSIQIT